MILGIVLIIVPAIFLSYCLAKRIINKRREKKEVIKKKMQAAGLDVGDPNVSNIIVPEEISR